MHDFKTTKKTDCRGIGQLVIIVVIVIVGVMGIVGKVVWDRHRSTIIKTDTITPLPAPASASTNDATSPTIKGTIGRTPTTPNCQQGQACSQAVTNTKLLFIDSKGATAATTTTNGTGNYYATLPLGTYTLKLDPATGTLQPNQITIHSGDNQLNISVDSGIR